MIFKTVYFNYAVTKSYFTLHCTDGTAKDLQVMSLEWIIQAHYADLDLNDVELYNLIAQIPKQEQVLANDLKYLVDNFHLEAIATLTQTQ